MIGCVEHQKLANSLRVYHPRVDEFVIPYAPADSDISTLLQQLTNYDLIILGTLNAYNQPGQQTVIWEALKLKIQTVVVALRLPYDLAAFPEARTYLCTYSILNHQCKLLRKQYSVTEKSRAICR